VSEPRDTVPDTVPDAAHDAVIVVEQLTRRFGTRTVVDGVTFSVARGAIFGLLGPNGSGKSTIIRMLCGVLPPSAGSATLLGFDVKQHAESIKSRIGYMSQSFSLYRDLTARENLRFYGRIYGLSDTRIQTRIDEVTELTAIRPYLDQIAGTLSGGWKQRLALACALIHEPDVLFLDEPTAGIDPVARRDLWDLLFELSGRGVTLFVTTHYMDEAERCTDIAYLHHSRLMVLGKPADLKALPAVTPVGTHRMEVALPRPAEHLTVLRALPGVLDATLFGETLHLLADKNVTAQAICEAAHDDNAEVRNITPSLEDVFVTLARAATDSMTPVVVTEVARPMAAVGEPQQASVTGGLMAILLKEFTHIAREPATLLFMFVIPLMQTIIFGLAIDTKVEHLPTVVFDLDGRSESRDLQQAFVNTRAFRIESQVHDEQSFQAALTSGRAKVGLRIPPDYSERLVRHEQALVQVLIDGSDSQIANTAQRTSQQLGIQLSRQIATQFLENNGSSPARDGYGATSLPIEIRTRLLYNPSLESARFFVPGLVGIILQMVLMFLTAFAVVRERELGTLEQLFVTPVSRFGLLLGKLIPYALVGMLETAIILAVMVYLFDVQIAGDLLVLLTLSGLFIITSLGIGLLISTLAKTQLQAMQYAFLALLPSVLLSGFMFPREEMPLPIYWATFAIPATWFVEILRGVILRGAGFMDLVPQVIGLLTCCFTLLSLSVMRFRKQLG
jgi:ribosome-dependent ATPase